MILQGGGACARAPHDAPARASGSVRGRQRAFTVDMHCHALTEAAEQLVADRCRRSLRNGKSRRA